MKKLLTQFKVPVHRAEENWMESSMPSKNKKSALTGNRTRVARVAGGHHAPRP
jgi:hypothetical protein